MKLTLKNIGKIENAVVELNGITVIAGENNTGKSTVGKALFSFFNSFYNVKNQIEIERKQTVEQIISTLFRDVSSARNMYVMESDEIAEEIINNITVESSHHDIERIIMSFFDRKERKSEKKIQNPMLDEVIDRIFEVIKISDDEILKNIIIKQTDSEFSGQISNVYSDKSGKVELIIKNEKAFFDVKDNFITKVSGKFDLHTEVVYIDNPFVLDEQRLSPFAIRFGNYLDHKNHLRRKLFSYDSSNDIINEIINTNKLNDIYEKISTVCSGEMVRNKRSGVGYKKKGSDKIIDIKNVSTGLKTFVILKTLLQNGTLQYNGTIILDEPEIHLHPQWQLLFAELIVLIQKEFN